MLLWVIVILVATNLSMGFSFLYHRQQDKKLMYEVKEEKLEVPAQQRTRFFREQLDLDPRQVIIFRELNREFNRTAWNIQHQLSSLRIQLVNELGDEQPDKEKLNSIAAKIGELHKQLKNETIDYYMAMKEACSKEQKEKLNDIFNAILEKNEDVRLPQGGRRYRNNR